MRRLPWLVALPVLLASTYAQAQPTFSMQFLTDTVGPGSSSDLVYTINNVGEPNVSDLAFTHTLSAGLLLTGTDPTTNCVEATLVAPPGGSTVTFSGARLGTSQTCTVRVSVTGSTPALYSNTTGDLTSSAGNSGPATDDLTIASDRPGFSLSASPSVIPYNGRTTLTYLVDNTLNASAVTTLSFSHTLPSGVAIASPSNLATTCGDPLIPPTLTGPAGGTSITLFANGISAFPALAAASTCTVVVDIRAQAVGEITLRTGVLAASSTPVGIAVETLTVLPVDRLQLGVDAIDDPTSPGGTATVAFTLSNFDRDDDATAVGFTVDFGAALAGLTVLSADTTPCGAGSTLTGMGGSLLTLSDGSLIAEDSCTFEVTLGVPAGATPGSYVITTAAITGTFGGAPLMFSSATETLFVQAVPLVTVEVLEVGTSNPNPVVGPGSSVVLRTTVVNTSTTSAATALTLQVPLTPTLPFPVTVTLPPVPDPPCGGGSSFTLSEDSFTKVKSLNLGNGSLPMAPGAASTCTWDVTLNLPPDLAGGVYDIAATGISATVDGATALGATSNDDFSVVEAPALTYQFAPQSNDAGAMVSVEYTLTHAPDASGPATDVAFSHEFGAALAGLTQVSPAATDLCGTGNGSHTGGMDPVDVFGITLNPGDICTFSLDVMIPTDALAGLYTSTTSPVSATVGGLATTHVGGSAELGVNGVELTAEFIPATALPGAAAVLRFTMENSSPTDAASGAFFTVDLTADLPGLTATGPASVNTCGGTLSGTTFLVYTGGSLAPGASCTIEVPVLIPPAAANGNYTVVTSSLSYTLDGMGLVSSPAIAGIIVADVLFADKRFVGGRGVLGGTAILEYEFTNTDPLQSIAGLGFTEDFGSALMGLAAVSSPVLDPCTGGSFMGSDVITFSGGTLPPATTCVVPITLALPSDYVGEVTTVTSTVSGTAGGLPTSAEGPSATLAIDGVLLSHDFGSSLPHGSSGTLTYTLESVDAVGTYSGLRLVHDLGAVIPGMTLVGAPQTDACGAGSSLSGAGASVTLNSATLSPSGSCTFNVEYLVPMSAITGPYPSVVGPVTQGGVPQSGVSSDTLVVTAPPPVFGASFVPATVVINETSTLVLTVDNSGGNGSVGALGFLDMLPAGLVFASPPNASTTCSGSAFTSGIEFSLTVGAVAANATCTWTADVTSPAPGTFSYTPVALTSAVGSSPPLGTATLTVTPPDTDGDGVPDPSDPDINDPTVCGDTDADGCDDCTNTGANGSGGDPGNDGTDGDGDGQCSATDSDDDGDGVSRPEDTDDTNASICQDTDEDTCDDCTNTGGNGSGGDPANDGPDEDGDGICDDGESDKKGGCAALPGPSLWVLLGLGAAWRRRRSRM